jgi:hypothetical protein
LNAYARAASLPDDDLKASNRMFEEALKLQHHQSSLAEPEEEEEEEDEEREKGCGGKGGGEGRCGGGFGGDSGKVPAAAALASAWLSYLEHAASVARGKFSRFDLPAMALGCALMVGSVAGHLALIAR